MIYRIKESYSNNIEIKFNSDGETTLLQSINYFGIINKIEKNNNIQNSINLNVLGFNPQNIKYIKKISDSFGIFDGFVNDGICFFISKNNEYVLAIKDSSCKSIIFYEINNNKEIKRIYNAHEK